MKFQAAQSTEQGGALAVFEDFDGYFAELYANLLDKGYSLTDCVSIIVIKQLGIHEIFTHDKHFIQEDLIIFFSLFSP
jgi:predicted nucleic acid-binding protein